MGSPAVSSKKGRSSGSKGYFSDPISESELASQQASDVASQQRRPNKSTGFALVRAHSCHPPPFVYILTDNEG
jgi:hypothetical protein